MISAIRFCPKCGGEIPADASDEGCLGCLLETGLGAFASAVRREIMQTVSAPHEVDGELRRLRSVFARAGQQAF